MGIGPGVEIGYALSSEEHRPLDLVRFAKAAEDVGFTFALISDHYHPWTSRQGQSPFVWSVLGALAVATQRLRIGTGVTCPISRIHPAIVAQAAATTAGMLPGRFFLGVGTGENLNEHVAGGDWPPAEVRLEMLEEAIGIIRDLLHGGEYSHRGRHFTVRDATIYTLPDGPVPIHIAAKGSSALKLAGRVGDGLIATAPDGTSVDTFLASGGAGKPRFGQATVCWGADELQARRTALEWWPNLAMPGDLSVELPLPRHFEQAAKLVRESDVCDQIPCGPDPDVHLEAIRAFERVGFDHVYVHQIGPDQDGFLRFYRDRVLPRLRTVTAVGGR